MDITPFVSDLQRQLIAAAERDFTDAGDNGVDDARASAERLASGLDATTRLVLLDALSAATGEITRDLVPGSVDLRLRGRDVEFVVSAPRPLPASTSTTPAPRAPRSACPTRLSPRSTRQRPRRASP